MEHLIVDVTSKRLHCSGSLQTSFDLLGELCKGNIQVLRILADFLNTEEKFRKLMSVAALNLVDSNVFFRSMILAVERMSRVCFICLLYCRSTDTLYHPRLPRTHNGTIPRCAGDRSKSS